MRGERQHPPSPAGARAVVRPAPLHPRPRGRHEAAAQSQEARGVLPEAEGSREGQEQGPVGAEPAQEALYR